MCAHLMKQYIGGLPWWSSGKESPSNAGDPGSIPGRGTKIPHATEQLSSHATTTELACLNEREKTRTSQLERHPRAAATREKPTRHNEDPTQPKINKFLKVKKKEYIGANTESTAVGVVRKTGERGVQRCEVNLRLEVRVAVTIEMTNWPSVKKGEGRQK